MDRTTDRIRGCLCRVHPATSRIWTSHSGSLLLSRCPTSVVSSFRSLEGPGRVEVSPVRVSDISRGRLSRTSVGGFSPHLAPRPRGPERLVCPDFFVTNKSVGGRKDSESTVWDTYSFRITSLMVMLKKKLSQKKKFSLKFGHK